MEIDSGDGTLQTLAGGGFMDYSSWPGLLSVIISRIEKTAHDDFPIPNIPPSSIPTLPPPPRLFAPLPSSDPLEPPESSEDTGSSSQETNKENANPSGPATSFLAAPPPLPISTGPVPARMPPTPPALEPGTLPAPLSSLLAEITDTLTTGFPTHPPHTIQRLSELVLRPKQHYRSLAAYLHALDRVVHVTSGADMYPLPPAIADMGNMSSGVVNGVSGHREGSSSASSSVSGRLEGVGTSVHAVGLGDGSEAFAAAAAAMSDDTLGGALLTPIPWLTRRVDEANGGSDEGGMENGSPNHNIAGGTAATAAAPPAPAQGQPHTLAQLLPGGTAPQRQGRPAMEGQVRTESTETIDGPNGMGSIETVSVSVNGIPSMSAAAIVLQQQQQQQQQQRGVTQGEVLRQEQQAGVVPVSQLARTGGVTASNGAGPPGAEHIDTSSENADETMDDETPHARGPDEIGAADMGPQSSTSSYMVGGSGGVRMHGIDVEAAVGRRYHVHHDDQGQEQRTSPEAQQAQQEARAEEEVEHETEEKTQQQQPGPATTSVPPSPKRQADEELDDSIAKKRLKEDGAAVEEPSAAEDGADVEEDGFVLVPESGRADAAVPLAPHSKKAKGTVEEHERDKVMEDVAAAAAAGPPGEEG